MGCHYTYQFKNFFGLSRNTQPFFDRDFQQIRQPVIRNQEVIDGFNKVKNLHYNHWKAIILSSKAYKKKKRDVRRLAKNVWVLRKNLMRGYMIGFTPFNRIQHVIINKFEFSLDNRLYQLWYLPNRQEPQEKHMLYDRCRLCDQVCELRTMGNELTPSDQ